MHMGLLELGTLHSTCVRHATLNLAQCREYVPDHFQSQLAHLWSIIYPIPRFYENLPPQLFSYSANKQTNESDNITSIKTVAELKCRFAIKMEGDKNAEASVCVTRLRRDAPAGGLSFSRASRDPAMQRSTSATLKLSWNSLAIHVNHTRSPTFEWTISVTRQHESDKHNQHHDAVSCANYKALTRGGTDHFGNIFLPMTVNFHLWLWPSKVASTVSRWTSTRNI